MSQRREVQSAYIEWAKLRADAKYSLAASDVKRCPMSELKARLSELEITGPGGYGFAPLVERLAARAGVEPENIVQAQGTSMANHLAMAALVESGYEAIVAAAEYLGARVRRFPRKFEAGFQVDPREVERAITPRTRMVVITNLHNPSSVRTPDSVLKMV